MAFEIVGSVVVAEALSAGTVAAMTAAEAAAAASAAASIGAGVVSAEEMAALGIADVSGDAAWGVNAANGGLTDEMLAQGAREAAVDQAASPGTGNTAQEGMSMADALKLAGVAAPLIGSLISSGAIKDASQAQQQATDAAIAQIQGSTAPAQAAVTQAQQTGAAGQNAALKTTLERLRAANEAGTAGEREALATATTNLKPYTDAGAGAIGQLALGTAPGGDLVRKFTTADLNADPVYQNGLQFGLDTGTAGINQRAIQAGNYDSGATLKALTRFGNDYGSTKAEGAYNRYTNDQSNVYSKLMGVSGVGQAATNSVNQLGYNTAANIANQGNTTANTMGGFETGTAGSVANSGNVAATNNANIGIAANNNIAQLLTGMGNVRGAASIATGNNFSNAGTSIANSINSQSTLDKILASRNPQVGWNNG